MMGAPSTPATGAPWWFIAASIALIVVTGVVLLVWAQRRGKSASSETPCRKCGRIMLAGWSSCKFCGAATATLAARGPAELQFISGPFGGRIVSLEIDVTTIGSAQGNTIQLADNGVSKRHIGIRKVGTDFELADLGSTNGVYVNGQKVARRQLAPGDVIRVGATEIVFRS